MQSSYQHAKCNSLFICLESDTVVVATKHEATTVARTNKKNKVIDERALIIDVTGAAVMLNKSRDKVYELIRAGELQSYLEGGRSRRVVIASIHAYINRMVTQPFTRGRFPSEARAPPDT
jgi:excisionase family DNA binding protein